MRLRDKSIEELLDLEEELIESRNDEKDGSLSNLINLYTELYRKISKSHDDEYSASLVHIKKKLVSYLVRYGTYLKTQYQKDDYAAERCLNSATTYQKELPIAYYRLGFLSYKKKRYIDALTYFQEAINYQEKCKEDHFQLNQQQLYNTHLYITNSALYLADESNKRLKKWETVELLNQVPNYERSSLYEIINSNETYFSNHAFTVTTQDSIRMCAEEDCYQLTEDNQLPNTLILYFSDRRHSLFFNGKDVELSINHAEILRYLLLHTSKDSPATKYAFSRIIESKDGEVKTNTYTKNIERIREKSINLGIPIEIISNIRHHGQTAYFYNRKIPFAIIHRSDSSFLLE